MQPHMCAHMTYNIHTHARTHAPLQILLPVPSPASSSTNPMFQKYNNVGGEFGGMELLGGGDADEEESEEE